MVRQLMAVVAGMLVAGCTTMTTTVPDTAPLFHDELFAPPTAQIHPESALEMSEPMLQFARTKLHHNLGHVDNQDVRQQLVTALYTKGELRLEYFSDSTKTAAEAFESRSGNCLSLVMLTAAFAKQLHLPYRYQLAVGAADWNEIDDFFMSINHVNIVLEEVPSEFELSTWTSTPLIVDFLVPDIAAKLDTIDIDERTVLSMYMNNRSVETMVRGNVDDAYWWAVKSIQTSPGYGNAYSTLAVIYRTRHRPDLAEKVLDQLAKFDPDNVSMLTDKILVLRDLGKNAEADRVAVRLEEIDRNRPWRTYFEGQSEYRAGHYDRARRLFEREIVDDGDRHEFEYGLALACAKLNDVPAAMQHLQRAIDLANSRRSRQKYEAKLDQLKSSGSM